MKRNETVALISQAPFQYCDRCFDFTVGDLKCRPPYENNVCVLSITSEINIYYYELIEKLRPFYLKMVSNYKTSYT